MLDQAAYGTAKILKMFDNIFDSCNGHSLYAKNGKELRCALSETSKHIQFWNEMKKYLSQMYFQKPGTKEKFVPPTLKNWIVTLNGLEDVFCILKQLDIGISFVKPRVFNQDPLENFFGQMRQQGSRNINPTVSLFRRHFKTLLINNLVTRHSLNSNCMEETSPILSVRNFVTQGIPEEEEEVNVPISNVEIPQELYTMVDKFSIGYVSGFVAKKVLKTLVSCNECKRELLCEDKAEWENSQWHLLVQEKEYFADAIPYKLKYCTPQFIRGLCTTYNILRHILPIVASQSYSYKTIIATLDEYVDFNFKKYNCGHNLKCIIIKKFTLLIIYNWVNGINRVLSGRETRIIKKDKIMEAARRYYISRKKTRH